MSDLVISRKDDRLFILDPSGQRPKQPAEVPRELQTLTTIRASKDFFPRGREFFVVGWSEWLRAGENLTSSAKTGATEEGPRVAACPGDSHLDSDAYDEFDMELLALLDNLE